MASGIDRPSSLVLRIEELVLYGFASSDRHRIAVAVERELARLLSQQGNPLHSATGGQMEQIEAESFTLVAGSHPGVIGGEIAQAVYGAMGRADSGHA